MKALSIRQPWAWLILHGGKLIENRVWNTSHRGEFIIHAAQGCSRAEFRSAIEWVASLRLAFPLWIIPTLDRIERGGIVGVATLDRVLRPGDVDHAPLRANRPDVDTRWHVPGQHGFVLRDVKPVPFERRTGSLGFFETDPLGIPGLIL